MLEPPDIQESLLEATVAREYGLGQPRVTFLPAGADMDSAAYLVASEAGGRFFLKLRRNAFTPASILIPQLLRDRGTKHIIAPLRTKTASAWVPVGEYYLALFPFIEGTNAFITPLSPAQWTELGAVMRALHTLPLPTELRDSLPHEGYSDRYRKVATALLEEIHASAFVDAPAAELAALFRQHEGTVRLLIERAARLAEPLVANPLPFVACHADLHAGNIMVEEDGRDFYVVDWDEVMLAPRERDLMFIGAGIGGIWNTPEESARFYEGYGAPDIDATALAHYRCERIVQDVVSYGSQLLLTSDGGADRERGLNRVRAAFEPNDVVEIALATP